ncbi:MAG: nucleoside transporter rane protein [Caproiciproducens sp.]|nr:nucleoside transporter rane protein [Caproiciproducens sp.]
MVKIVKKKESSSMQSTLLRVGSVLIALVASAAFIAALGYNPFVVYQNIVAGSVGSTYRFQETINKTIPLIVLSLGIAVSFKMKFMNIGAEGQFYLGAMAATAIALNFPTWPIYILIPVMMLGSIIAGGIWCLFPAVLKSKFGTSETLVTLMMNYIAVKIVSYLQYGPWKDPKAKGFPRIAKFSVNAVLPKVFGIHIGWIIALVLVVIIYIIMSKSKLGYQISVLGENENTAKYAGMDTAKILFISVIIGGGLCGLAGMIQASGIEGSLTDQLSGGLGFTAIITAWLANLSAPAILVVSFFFAILVQGSTYIQSSMQIPSAVAEILQGIIIFFVLASEFFTQYKFVVVHKVNKEAAK